MLKKLSLALFVSALAACGSNNALAPNDPLEYVDPDNWEYMTDSGGTLQTQGTVPTTSAPSTTVRDDGR